MPRAALAWSVGASLLTGATVAWLSTLPVTLAPGSPGFSLLRGASPSGEVRQTAMLVLPGLDRRTARPLILAARGVDGRPTILTLRVDGGEPQPLRVTGQAEILTLPAASVPSLRLDLQALPPAAFEVTRIEIAGVRPRLVVPVLVTAAAFAGIILLFNHAPAVAVPLVAALFAFATAAALPSLVFSLFPAPGAMARAAAPLIALLFSLWLGLRMGSRRRAYLEGVGLLAALVFGIWVRLFFLPSSGSWDTEYWKAWMRRAATEGVSRVYGDPEAVPPGHFAAQMRGQEPLWLLPAHGREFVVDYPPLAMALWRAAWWITARHGPQDFTEAQNVAVKLPAVLGDVAAAALLALLWRARPRRGLTLAALYWALPVSWLSSAVLGFLDGACAPLILLALVAAARSRGTWSGAALAMACLLKPTAVIVAPAVTVALWPARKQVALALGAGLGTVAAVLVPFALAGTLRTAIVHCYRILFQGTLSGGFPNPWWLLGHALHVARGEAPLRGPAGFFRLDVLGVPVRPLGSLLFLALAAWLCRSQWKARGRGPALLTGAGLFFAYGLVAIGVHENHPHPLFLLLLAAGLRGARAQAIAAASATVYVLNMLCLSGLGRFHGPRHLALAPVAEAVSRWRMGAGFDLTLLLAAVNVGLFVYLLVHWRGELTRTQERLANGTEGSRVDTEETWAHESPST